MAHGLKEESLGTAWTTDFPVQVSRALTVPEQVNRESSAQSDAPEGATWAHAKKD